jgi:hypothetical protein
MANILLMITSWGKATKNNDSVSHFFMIYQVMMLVSSVVR